MSILASFIKEPKNIAYDGEDADEHIRYLLRRSWITNLPWVLGLVMMFFGTFIIFPYLRSLQLDGQALVKPEFIIVLSWSWFLAIFGLFILYFANWFFNVYIITNKKIIDFDFFGLTYKNISDAPLTNIQDVTAKISGPFNMIFNIGDVFIQTAAENREFDFAQIDDPGKVRDIISDMITERGAKSGNI